MLRCPDDGYIKAVYIVRTRYGGNAVCIHFNGHGGNGKVVLGGIGLLQDIGTLFEVGKMYLAPAVGGHYLLVGTAVGGVARKCEHCPCNGLVRLLLVGLAEIQITCNTVVYSSSVLMHIGMGDHALSCGEFPVLRGVVVSVHVVVGYLSAPCGIALLFVNGIGRTHNKAEGNALIGVYDLILEIDHKCLYFGEIKGCAILLCEGILSPAVMLLYLGPAVTGFKSILYKMWSEHLDRGIADGGIPIVYDDVDSIQCYL